MSQSHDKSSTRAGVTRFAPSPTGYLHLGHARAAAQAFGLAKAQGGTCLLRIEDIDRARCRPEFTEAIYEDLHWLGFEWPQPVRVQSAHFSDYQAALEVLAARGLIYRCFLTRKEMAALGPASRVFKGAPAPDEARRLARGDDFAWRLSGIAARAALGTSALSYFEGDEAQTVWLKDLGDEIIARKDIGVSYHLAVTHDDALQGVTHIVRGADIGPSTGVHVLLQRLMGWPVPIYHHHSLVLASDGEKLSKRRGDTAIRALREAGLSPAQVLALAQDGAAG